jgi:hypothetical protein
MVELARAVAAVPAAMLPRRYWPALDEFVPASQAALVSSLATLLGGAALGIYGFLSHLTAVASANNVVYLRAAERVAGDTMPLPSAISALTPFTFLLLTPQGWASTYLVLSGLVRAAGSAFDDPHGDFILTLSDAGIRAARQRSMRRAGANRRLRLEGPAVRDRIVAGAPLGFPQAEIVIVSSRVKEGWDSGAVVLSDRGAFRILAVEDRTIDGRLRRLYALAPHTDLEAIRRAVRYEFPAGSNAGV